MLSPACAQAGCRAGYQAAEAWVRPHCRAALWSLPPTPPTGPSFMDCKFLLGLSPSPDGSLAGFHLPCLGSCYSQCVHGHCPTSSPQHQKTTKVSQLCE